MKKILLFTVIGLNVVSPFGASTSSYSMDATESAKSPVVPLSQQIEAVKAYAEPREKRYLVLGVNNGEIGLERFSEDYIFLDSKQSNPQGRPSLAVDFNDINQLAELANALPNFFDRIILDDSTFKATRWTTENIQLLKKMLKNGGRFIFGPPFIQSPSVEANDGSKTIEDAWKLAKVSSGYDSNKFASSYKTLSPFPYNESVNVDDLYRHIMDTVKGIDDDDQSTEALYNEELPLYDLSVIRRDDFKDILQANVSREAAFNKFRKEFFWTILVPENYQRLTEEVFGKRNVIVEKDKPLPFKSNYNERQVALITATKND